MKLRKSRIDITDDVERQAVEVVRQLTADTNQAKMSAPPDAYFANLLVKSNSRIDHVTSGKALSMSWLARVAVPGVVAILFFFIGLHYYVPEVSTERHSIADAVKALPSEAIDSMLIESSSNGLLSAALTSELLDVSNDQLAEFLVASGSPSAVLEVLPEQQLTEIAALLESRSTNL
jgi:hypothetical protein